MLISIILERQGTPHNETSKNFISDYAEKFTELIGYAVLVKEHRLVCFQLPGTLKELTVHFTKKEHASGRTVTTSMLS